MQRRTNPSGSIKFIYHSHECGKNIVSCEFIGPQILNARISDITYHSDNLRADDESLKLFEALNIIKQEIQKACRYQKIPRYIEHGKIFVERNYIVERTVNNVTTLVGN